MKKILILLTTFLFPLILFAQENGAPYNAIVKEITLPLNPIKIQTNLAIHISIFDIAASKKDISELLKITGYTTSSPMFERQIEEGLAAIEDCKEIRSRIKKLLFTSYPYIIDTKMEHIKTSVTISEKNIKNNFIKAVNNAVFSKLEKLCGTGVAEVEQYAFTLELRDAWKHSQNQYTEESRATIHELLKQQNILND